MIQDEFGQDHVRLLPPGTHKCPLCADRHLPHEPHNRNSLYYQMRFYQDHGRFPTWADALTDCSPFMHAYWRGEMTKKGVRREETRSDGR